jgi:hypothetical protein
MLEGSRFVRSSELAVRWKQKRTVPIGYQRKIPETTTIAWAWHARFENPSQRTSCQKLHDRAPLDYKMMVLLLRSHLKELQSQLATWYLSFQAARRSVHLSFCSCGGTKVCDGAPSQRKKALHRAPRWCLVRHLPPHTRTHSKYRPPHTVSSVQDQEIFALVESSYHRFVLVATERPVRHRKQYNHVAIH